MCLYLSVWVPFKIFFFSRSVYPKLLQSFSSDAWSLWTTITIRSSTGVYVCVCVFEIQPKFFSFFNEFSMYFFYHLMRICDYWEKVIIKRNVIHHHHHRHNFRVLFSSLISWSLEKLFFYMKMYRKMDSIHLKNIFKFFPLILLATLFIILSSSSSSSMNGKSLLNNRFDYSDLVQSTPKWFKKKTKIDHW